MNRTKDCVCEVCTTSTPTSLMRGAPLWWMTTFLAFLELGTWELSCEKFLPHLMQVCFWVFLASLCGFLFPKATAKAFSQRIAPKIKFSLHLHRIHLLHLPHLSYIFFITISSTSHIQVVPGQAGGGSFKFKTLLAYRGACKDCAYMVHQTFCASQQQAFDLSF